MSNKPQKSKKDLAFEKERAKYRSEIRKLERENKEKLLQIIELKDTIEEKDEIIRQKDEWICRLLEYTELTEEDMKKLVAKDKAAGEAMKHLSSIMGIFGSLRGSYL